MENLRKIAVNEMKKYIKAHPDYDFQEVIEAVLNNSDQYSALFAGMSEDERFTEAYEILSDAEPEM